MLFLISGGQEFPRKGLSSESAQAPVVERFILGFIKHRCHDEGEVPEIAGALPSISYSSVCHTIT